MRVRHGGSVRTRMPLGASVRPHPPTHSTGCRMISEPGYRRSQEAGGVSFRSMAVTWVYHAVTWDWKEASRVLVKGTVQVDFRSPLLAVFLSSPLRCDETNRSVSVSLQRGERRRSSSIRSAAHRDVPNVIHPYVPFAFGGSIIIVTNVLMLELESF
jgi:hypothetical protein